MKVIPQNNMVLCKQVQSDKAQTKSGFIYEVPQVPLYQIAQFSKSIKDANGFKVGDVIMANSTGTMLMVDGEKMFLFNMDNIVGKTIDD